MRGKRLALHQLFPSPRIREEAGVEQDEAFACEQHHTHSKHKVLSGNDMMTIRRGKYEEREPG